MQSGVNFDSIIEQVNDAEMDDPEYFNGGLPQISEMAADEDRGTEIFAKRAGSETELEAAHQVEETIEEFQRN